MLTIGYIGNGKNTNRYHLPYVLARPADYETLTYQTEQSVMEEHFPTAAGDYGRVYDTLHDAICFGAPQKVTQEQVLTQMQILEHSCAILY